MKKYILGAIGFSFIAAGAYGLITLILCGNLNFKEVFITLIYALLGYSAGYRDRKREN